MLHRSEFAEDYDVEDAFETLAVEDEEDFGRLVSYLAFSGLEKKDTGGLLSSMTSQSSFVMGDSHRGDSHGNHGISPADSTSLNSPGPIG